MQRSACAAMVGLNLCLCACATSGPRHLGVTREKSNGDYDSIKVATVNRWALYHGATVIWVSYPQKRKASGGD